MRNEEQKQEIITYIEKASVALIGLLFIIFPVTFTSLTTDFFNLPKQILVVFLVSALFILFGIKTVLSEKVLVRRTPFDAPLLIFLVVLLVSTVLSVAKYDSLVNFIPVLFAGLSYFAITFNAKNERNILVLSSCLLIGGVLVSLISVFSYMNIYLFPYDFTKTQFFTPAGSYVDQALYLLFLVPLALYFLTPFVTKRGQVNLGKDNLSKLLGFGAASAIILGGILTSGYILLKQNAFVILPLDTGFQTAFAAISQDSGRVLQALLFGTGFGEFFIDFSKFKLASFNSSQYWSINFLHSSSFVLELLATTGLAGLLSFLYLCFRIIKERPLFLPLIVIIAVSFILPLTFYPLTLFFFMLGIYSSIKGLHDDQKYFDVEVQLVALKKGILAFSLEESAHKRNNKKLSYIVLSVIVLFALLFGFLSFDFALANVTFEKSIVAANQNNGQLTYTYQNQALSSFTGKYIDSYYRVFSQTNLALANTLASSIPQGASPSAQSTQTIYTLVQQSINSARQATVVSPQNSLNWQNLAVIYRSLIGFGQNADQFAVSAQQQATALDPNNPQEYIILGGIYYQLRSWDNAQAQFQQAATLKQDYPNAYYNLGHVLQEKGDLQGALTQYNTVRNLVQNDSANLKKIDEEIATVQSMLGQQAQQQQAQQQQSAQPLALPTTDTLPTQNPPVKIPGPSGTVTPTPTETVSPKVTPTPTP